MYGFRNVGCFENIKYTTPENYKFSETLNINFPKTHNFRELYIQRFPKIPKIGEKNYIYIYTSFPKI